MNVYYSLEEFRIPKNAVVTTGTFDGVHLGHKKVLSQLKKSTLFNLGHSVIITFHPHPRSVLFPENTDLKLLNSLDEKINLLEGFGIDNLLILPFTRTFSRLSSIEFVRDILVNKVGTKKLIIGYNHQFGRNREGTFEHLKEFSSTYGFEVEEISAFDINDINISSTKIREALVLGKVNLANQYLGYHYMLSGKVVEGDKIGRTLGFPTANIMVSDSNKLIPGSGVYAVLVEIDNKQYKGMLNVGTRPTVSNSEKTTIEVNLFDFNEIIYNKELTIKFVMRIRNEQKFDSIEKMQEQMRNDKTKSLSLLS